MTKTQSHAKRELEILFKTTPDAIIREFETEILALVEKFGDSGQSGGSAPYTAGALSSAIKALCLQQTIAPLTGEDSEWGDISENDVEKSYQNNRDSAIFKVGKDGRAYYLKAVIFKGETGSCFTSGSVELPNEAGLENGKTIGSRQFIKSFPFKPKSFYIDVIETEWADKEQKVKQQGGGWWTSVIKDEKQLEEVYEYYDKK